MANNIKIKSSVKLMGKPPVYAQSTLSKPQAKPQARTVKSKSLDEGLPWDMTAPEAWENKVYSMEEALGHLSNAERLTIELERFGHFTVEEGGCWIQTEIDAEWARLNASKLAEASTERSPAFVLN